MVAFCDSVLDTIKRASTERHLKEVVTMSFDELRHSGHRPDEALYTLNMIVALHAAEEHASASERKNIQLALAYFRESRRKNQQLLF